MITLQRDPFAVLGPHIQDGEVTIRTMQPAARAGDVRLLPGGEARPMTLVDREGLYEVRLAGDQIPDYRLRVTFPNDHVVEVDDPYRYGRVLSDFDLYLFGEGNQLRAF